MPTVYFANYMTCRPEPVVCDEPGYPNRDARGRMMYENTHYPTEEACWQRIVAETEAGVSLSTSEVERCEQALDHARVALATSCKQWKAARDGYAKRTNVQGGK